MNRYDLVYIALIVFTSYWFTRGSQKRCVEIWENVEKERVKRFPEAHVKWVSNMPDECLTERGQVLALYKKRLLGLGILLVFGVIPSLIFGHYWMAATCF